LGCLLFKIISLLFKIISYLHFYK